MATHTTVEHRWPDLRVGWKKKQLIEIFDMACPLDCNVIEKEKEKIKDYSQLCYDLRRQNPTDRVIFHPLVIGTTDRLNSNGRYFRCNLPLRNRVMQYRKQRLNDIQHNSVSNRTNQQTTLMRRYHQLVLN